MSGYACIHRKIFDNPVFRDDLDAMIFAWMVIKAAWKPTRVSYKGRIIELKRGQLAITVRDLATRFRQSPPAIQRLLTRYTTDTLTDTQTDTGVTIVTIRNYSKYQEKQGGADTPADTPPIDNRYTEQEGKKLRKEALAKASVSPKAAEKMPLQAAVDNWNSMAGAHGWKQILSLNDKRSEHLRCRLREHGLKGWIEALKKAGNSVYLGGSQPPTWFTFDWLVKSPTNYLKLMEGNYDQSRTTGADEASPIRSAVEQLLSEGRR